MDYPDPMDTAFDIHPFDAPLGAEVVGLDLSRPLPDEDFARIHRAHLDHHVLVFRDLRITPRQQIDFSRRFGPLEIHVLHQFLLPGHPEILIVSNIKENGQPIGLGDAGAYWHSDLSYKERPSLGSLLHAQELPQEGGDTLFANMHRAWDTLPAHLREAVAGLRAEHSYLAKYEELRRRSPWRPKLSDEQLAQVRPAGASGRAHASGDGPQGAVRQRALHDAHRRPARGRERRPAGAAVRAQRAREHVHRHRWQPHDMVFWDNRSVLHLATGCPDPMRRRLNRTTVEGDAPF
jgi:taurine dioxygenase